jgi:hypothetical protein
VYQNIGVQLFHYISVDLQHLWFDILKREKREKKERRKFGRMVNKWQLVSGQST